MDHRFNPATSLPQTPRMPRNIRRLDRFKVCRQLFTDDVRTSMYEGKLQARSPQTSQSASSLVPPTSNSTLFSVMVPDLNNPNNVRQAVVSVQYSYIQLPQGVEVSNEAQQNPPPAHLDQVDCIRNQRPTEDDETSEDGKNKNDGTENDEYDNPAFAGYAMDEMVIGEVEVETVASRNDEAIEELRSEFMGIEVIDLGRTVTPESAPTVVEIFPDYQIQADHEIEVGNEVEIPEVDTYDPDSPVSLLCNNNEENIDYIDSDGALSPGFRRPFSRRPSSTSISEPETPSTPTSEPGTPFSGLLVIDMSSVQTSTPKHQTKHLSQKQVHLMRIRPASIR